MQFRTLLPEALEFKQLLPYQSLSKAYARIPLSEETMLHFRSQQNLMLEKLEQDETEEHAKTYVRDFLRSVWYGGHEVNTRKDVDLVIHYGSKANSGIGVLLEAKRPANKTEFPKNTDLRCKALYELLYYYLQERLQGSNQIAWLVITNGYEWYFLDEKWFAENAFQNKKLKAEFEHYHKNKHTYEFYKEIAAPFFNTERPELPFVYVDFRTYAQDLNTPDFESLAPNKQYQLTMLYKLFSPQHLLKLNFQNTGNNLDRGFYFELLHLLGLEEITEAKTNKLIITRLPASKRSPGSLLESTITQLKENGITKRPNILQKFGAEKEEQLFNLAIELVITWLNRILFLKLLEAQLIRYHSSNKESGPDYAFLSPVRLTDYNDLNRLFFRILNTLPEERDEVLKAYNHIPYLNSSLFETTETENISIRISNLDHKTTHTIFAATVLKDHAGNRLSSAKSLPWLQYMLSFLDAYDFSSEGGGQVRKDSKTLMSAKVLGLIFEKINGYAEGSVYTPGYITEYMCRETIRQSLLKKLNEAFNLEAGEWNELINSSSKLFRDKLARNRANTVVNSLKICDPAVGSGHFPVSALNEIIAIKSELGILADENGDVLPVEIEVSEDELVILERTGEVFTYYANSKGNTLRIQRTLFLEKQLIIENCLFGVDINPNSAKICRLRLWIELLKQAFYENGALQTLPNIDINIKEGNSLVYKFMLTSQLDNPKQQRLIEEYSGWVKEYKNTTDKERKHGLNQLLKDSIAALSVQMQNYDPRKIERQKLAEQLDLVLRPGILRVKLTPIELMLRNQQVEKLEAAIKAISDELKQEEAGQLYKNALEWRFIFPEILNNEGNFEGFDIVVGNPPYIRQEDLGDLKKVLVKNYKVYAGTADIYQYFFELGVNLLKPAGQICFIVSNKWMLAAYGEVLRLYLAKYTVHRLIDFGDLRVFDAATAYPCIIHISPVAAPEGHQFPFVKVKTLEFENKLRGYVQENLRLTTQSELSPEGWNLSDKRTRNLLDKIKAAGIPLGEYVGGKIFYGIKTGLNEAFVIDAATRERLIAEDPKSAEIIKPFLAGRDIKRYRKPNKNNFLIFTRRGINLEEYPAIKNHLEQFKIGLEPCPQDWNPMIKGVWPGRKKGTYKWYEIQDTVKYWKEFEKPKIIIPCIIQKPESYYDKDGYFSNDKTTIIPATRLWLYAILNAKITGFWMSQTAPTKRGGFYEYKPAYLVKIPIIVPDDSIKKVLAKLVNKVTTGKTTNKDTTHLETEIDALVYQLYGLTEDEIAIVEGLE